MTAFFSVESMEMLADYAVRDFQANRLPGLKVRSMLYTRDVDLPPIRRRSVPSPWSHNPQKDRNARLIASTPKLLEACRQAAILCADYADGAPDSTLFGRECNRLGELLDTAISEAT